MFRAIFIAPLAKFLTVYLVTSRLFAESELADDTKAMEDEQKKLQEKIFKLLKGEPIDDETFDLPMAGLSALMSNVGEASSSADDGTFQQVLNAIVSNPVLKSLAGVKPNVSAAAAVSAPRLPVTPLLSVRQPMPVPPVYGAHMPGGMTSFFPPEPFNGRPRPLLRAPGPPPLWPGYWRELVQGVELSFRKVLVTTLRDC